jgi:hypothetical protein
LVVDILFDTFEDRSAAWQWKEDELQARRAAQREAEALT